ncbi:hypothetical protein [Occallatibacter riparius]|uniref:Uncharacterized protein n=1 Tax=Occallatibacter riparius TaxID=1002689 RepID=A0A9J7BN79_9BACT|nr:hypothetical protein [Occallatibacter riparius]UWZ83961.1 hypothetical protein MOP44_25805 [Occallatibacter riparius]
MLPKGKWAMLPSQFRRLIDTLHTQLGAIRETLQNQEDARRDAQEGTEQKWREVPGIIASSVLGTADDRKAAESQKKKENAYQEDLIASQNKLVKWTRRAFLAACAYAAVALWQGYLTNRTIIEMRMANEAASRQLTVAENALDTSMSQFDRTMGALIDQTASTKRSAGAAEKSVEAAQDQMRVDQRAWLAPFNACGLYPGVWKLGTADGECPEPPAGTQPIGAVVFFRNAGKTPAFNVRDKVAWQTIDNLPKTDDPPPDEREGNIFPNGVLNIPWKADSLVASTISAGAENYAIMGTVWYDDILGNPHWTQYCFEARRRLTGFHPCLAHNATDDQHKKH